MAVDWQNRSPLPGGRDEEATAEGRKTVAQAGARERWAPESPGGTVHRSQRWGGGDWKAAWGRLCRFPPHFTPKGVRPPLAHMQESSHVFEPGQTWGHGPPPRHENGLGREQARPLEGWGPRAKALRAGVFFPH